MLFTSLVSRTARLAQARAPSSRVPGAVRKRQATRRLSLERLEERAVLSGGIVTTAIGNANYAQALASYLDHSGNIVVAGRTIFTANAGQSYDTALLRYTADGALDPAFGNGGVVRTPVTMYSDGAYAAVEYLTNKILLVGYAVNNHLNTDFALARYTADGSLDTTFGAAGKKSTGTVTTDLGAYDGIMGVVVQPDGKIVAAGATTSVSNGAQGQLALARYTSTGALDPTFGTNGFLISPLGPQVVWCDRFNSTQPVVLHDGKILVCGEAPTNGRDFELLQYNLDGTPDTNFGQDLNGDGVPDGKVITDFGGRDEAFALAVDKVDNIVVLGNVYRFDPAGGGDCRFGLARYLPNGTSTPALASVGWR